MAVRPLTLYKVLVEAFLSNKQVDTAQRIIEWLKDQSEYRYIYMTSVYYLDQPEESSSYNIDILNIETCNVHVLLAL